MKFLNFQKQLQGYPLFSIHDLRLIFPQENIHTVNKQISVWAQQGKIIKLRNGLYVLSADYTKEMITLELMASKIYSPSYLSLEYALSLYGIIPEAVFEMTSVTTKPTRTFHTSFGIFQYRKIKSSCFLGFTSVKSGKLSYLLALPEKALVDFLYLNSRRFIPAFQTWKELRLQNLQKLNFKLAIDFAKKFRQKKLLILILDIQKHAASN